MKTWAKVTLAWIAVFVYIGLLAYGLHQASRIGGL